MINIRPTFRADLIIGRQGTICYAIICNRKVEYITTTYRVYEHEWNAEKSRVELHTARGNRADYLLSVEAEINEDIRRLYSIVDAMKDRGETCTALKIATAFDESRGSLEMYMTKLIKNLKEMGKERTAETYASTLKSFTRFRQGYTTPMYEIDSEMMLRYEAWLRGRNVTQNSSSFYMRILRATYNRAVEKGLITQRNPFKYVYTGVAKTIKRALPLRVVKQIKSMNLEDRQEYDYARDMFLFSFYTRGMSLVDMAYLKKSDLKNGVLTYRRRKTGQPLRIKWEKCMQQIVDKYNTTGSDYLLPIINQRKKMNERKQYLNSAHKINKILKQIGDELNLTMPLTTYVARHSWASIAKSKNVPISVISEGMGHDSETTTRIYLASLDTMAIDRANRKILNLL